jgi:hypothetical protein
MSDDIASDLESPPHKEFQPMNQVSQIMLINLTVTYDCCE